jgi:hypothetical protein
MHIIKCCFILVAFLVASCTVQAPVEDEVKVKVYEYYNQLASAADHIQFQIEKINIQSIEPEAERKNVYRTTFVANGWVVSDALPNDQSKAAFTDTLTMLLQWNGSKWISLPKN